MRAQGNREHRELNSKNPQVMFTKNSVLLLEEERGNVGEQTVLENSLRGFSMQPALPAG